MSERDEFSEELLDIFLRNQRPIYDPAPMESPSNVATLTTGEISADRIRVVAEPVRASSFYTGDFSGDVIEATPIKIGESCESCSTEEKLELYTYTGNQGYVIKTLCEDCWVISHGRGEHV